MPHSPSSETIVGMWYQKDVFGRRDDSSSTSESYLFRSDGKVLYRNSTLHKKDNYQILDYKYLGDGWWADLTYAGGIMNRFRTNGTVMLRYFNAYRDVFTRAGN